MINLNEIKVELKRLILKNSFENAIPPDNNSIYHYTNIDSLKSIFINKQLRASNSMFLNDKLEVIHLRKLVRIIAAEVSNSLSKADQAEFTNFVEGLFYHTIRILSKSIFILSFSLKYDSLPLWNNFSKNDGYCLGFHFDKFINNFRKDNIKKILKPLPDTEINIEILALFNNVIYEEDLKKSRLGEYVKLLFKIKHESEEKMPQELIDIISLIALQILFIGYFSKEDCFSDEHEFRVIIFIKDYPQNIIKYRISNGIIIPYIDININDTELNVLPIKEIIIGPKVNIDIASEGIDYFIKDNGYSDIIIINSKIPLRY
jgi:hypothetical protein